MKEIEHVRRIVYDSASLWNRVSNVEILESTNDEADIEIGFEEFDLQESVLGVINKNKTKITFNNNINWTYHSNSDKEMNLNQAMLHQLGHVLGLHHSDHPNTIMYPYYNHSNEKLHEYDTTMVQRLYGPKGDQGVTRPTPIQTTPTRYIKLLKKGPSGLPVDPCNSQVDAVEIIDNQIFMFRHDKYWQVDIKEGTLHARPRLIQEYWPELIKWPIDAVLEMSGNELVFIDNQVLTFHNRRLKTIQNLTEFGFPEDVKKIRLAYKWIYGDVKHFVWNATHYWKLNGQTMKVEVDYPRRISTVWNSVPDGPSAAFTWGKDLYFVDAGELYKFDSFKMDIARGSPRRFSQVFQYCMPKAEALTSNQTSKVNVIHLLFASILYLIF